ncbi:MFS transporter [Verminephrobacter eiseniae]|uniref:MFS transporter n=1 Tax=Verminephrobacter eiseniae TaxID=364317 RepID=UPI0010E7D13F|nr:MFS transporter [Verminephrobacter eiseniae]KAB7627413.1 MFS transporter [Verminephrobacter sp. Larva24]MCW5230416.1 MFS transporter [Verminephrobacter eiseniae]MCW5260379.1 MFS transporter [Verminephrobacter eiseniae]MCW5292150.1 MFS transporter [Verminephrobacter eiseniae]MCW8187229.1 MFS transporter [Verminephrobacter eiseniae]
MRETCTTASPSAAADRLPMGGLLALAMTGFIAVLTENMPAGLLPEISRGLGVSQALAGQLVTLYALGAVVAAIPLMVATRGWSRRSLLLLAIGGFFVFNTVTALSDHYVVTLAARFVAGIAAGLAWGLLASYARRMVKHSLQGRALAVAMVGPPLALCLGVPLGTWLGTVMQWRFIFGIISGLALLLMVWVVAVVPNYPGQSARQRQSVRAIFVTPGLRPILFTILAWVLAHNVLYTYIAPFLASVAMGDRIDIVLLVFGISAMLGIWLIGMFIDRYLRALVLLSIAAFVASGIALGTSDASAPVVFVAVAIWGMTLGGASTLLQTAVGDVAGDGADVAQSMLVTVWNLAVAGGGFVGGVLLESAGPRALPWVLAALALVGFFAALQARARSFRPGRRAAQMALADGTHPFDSGNLK